jgi:putative phosphoesterase
MDSAAWPSHPRNVLTTHAKLGSTAQAAVRLAVVADTHGHEHANTTSLLNRLVPHAVLHAGDIGDHAVLARLGVVAPVHAVRGNIDAVDAATPDVLVVDVETAAGGARIVVLHIAVNGPKLRADAHRIAAKHGADLVVCGHSHVPFIGRDRGVTVFNPGSVGPRRFMLPIVLGTIDLDASGLRLRHFDCETGALWQPPALPSF